MINTRDLRSFVAVSEHLNFTRAAASLYLSQPALSKQIASLERTLDVQLFVRGREGVVLTRAGEALLPYARRMVELEERAVGEIRSAVAMTHGLTIGFWVAPGDEMLSRAIAEFSAHHPGVRLRLRRAAWADQGAGVETNRADIGLVWTAHDCPPRGLRSHRLVAEDILLAVQEGHPLTRRPYIVPRDVAGETIFVLPEGAGAIARKSRLVPEQGPHGAHHVVATTADEIIQGIANGLGVCVSTASSVAAYPHPRVTTVPMREVEPSDFCLVWREEDEHLPEIQDLIQALIDAWDWMARGRSRPTLRRVE
jgi:DNA-binding transcriptional LysR family regulator